MLKFNVVPSQRARVCEGCAFIFPLWYKTPLYSGCTYHCWLAPHMLYFISSPTVWYIHDVFLPLPSIAGVELFAGQFYRCLDADGNRVNASIIPDKETCLNTTGVSWNNTNINFDDALKGMLALFQVVSDIMMRPWRGNVFRINDISMG